MEPNQFVQAVERVRQSHNSLAAKAQQVLKRALPEIEQNEKTHFSTRLLLLMHSRANGRLAESDYEILRLALVALAKHEAELLQWLTAIREPRTAATLRSQMQRIQDSEVELDRHSAAIDKLISEG